MIRLFPSIILLIISVSAQAQNSNGDSTADLYLGLPSYGTSSQQSASEFLRLAATEMDTQSSMVSKPDQPAESQFKERTFTANKIHKYLGIGSIAAAGLTLISPKEEDGAHEGFAKTSAALGLAAVATGLIYHYEDLNLDYGFDDPDNLHALLSGFGAIGLAMAASKGPDSPHAGYGSVGAISMLFGIKYTW